MTNFLPAGIITDGLKEIHNRIADLRISIAAGNNGQAQKELRELENTVQQMCSFFEEFSCQPLVYTGPGTTEEIITRLEWALVFSEGIDSDAVLKVQQDINRKKSMG